MQKWCRDCRFFVPHTMVRHRMDGIQIGGECRCESPTLQVGPLSPGVFPVVLEDDWCRQFTPRVDLHREAVAAALDLRRGDSMVPSPPK